MSFFFEFDAINAQNDCYIIFQRNFPAPDGMIVVCSLICSAGLRRRKEWAVLWGLVAVGGLLFLGLIDISYNLWNNMYFKASKGIGVEIFINILCMLFSYYLMKFLWRNRNQLEK